MISNKCYYALKAMLELAVREGAGPVTIGDIAEAQNIPVRFLEAILRQLKQAGFAESARGKDGGYYLATPARSISVGNIIRLFEGELVAVNQQAGPSRERAALRDVFQNVWDEAEQALASVFDKTNFGAMAEMEKSRGLAHIANYSI